MAAVFASSEANAESFDSSAAIALTRLVSQHDGPNCFNAALVGSNFVFLLRYVDGSEYAFYLETHCQKRKGGAQAGDHIVFRDETGHVVHAALLLDGDFILEKTSSSGAVGRTNSGLERPGVYAIKGKTESPFFSGKNGTFKTETFRCESSKVGHRNIEAQNRTAIVAVIQHLQDQLDSKLKSPVIEGLGELSGDVLDLTEILRTLEGRDNADLYALARAASVWGALQESLIETNGVFVTGLYDDSRALHLEIVRLAKRMRRKNADARTLRVLHEIQ